MKEDAKTTETFAEKIARLKEEERMAAIKEAQAKQGAEDNADIVIYRKAYFGNPTLAIGTVTKVTDGSATIQLEPSTTAKYPRADRINAAGEITVNRAASLVVRAGKKERVGITPAVGQRGAVETIQFNGVVDLVFILDERETA